MTFARFLLPLLLLLSPLGLASAQQIAPPKPISSAQNIQKPSAAEQLAEERDARREAEHKQALADAKTELMDSANSRMEVLIGGFGLIIAVIGIIAGFAIRGEAREAKLQAETAANISGVEATKAAKIEMLEFRQQAQAIMNNLRDTHGEAIQLTDALRVKLVALPGDPATPAPTEEQELELAEHVRRILKRPKTEWSALDYRSMMLDAERSSNWESYIEISSAMAWNFEQSNEDLAHALYALGYGHGMLNNHRKAAQVFSRYVDLFPNESTNNRANAFVNWGVALIRISEVNRKKNDIQGAVDSLNQSCTKFENAISIDHESHQAYSRWSDALLKLSHLSDENEKANFLDQAYDHSLRANEIFMGYGSYNLACVSAQRGDASQAANWLRDAKKNDPEFPECAHIENDEDFKVVRPTPEFQQALIDIGCKSEAPQTPLETPKPTPRKPRKAKA